MNIDKSKTVVVAMSGGVDSSVAALLLKEQGYHCIGVTMQLLDYEALGENVNRENGCCSLESINDARLVCDKLGISHYVADFSKDFHREVIGKFVDEYLAGNTPNPCVLCNAKIKWERLIEDALKQGADYIATGHYARIRYNEESGRYELWRAAHHQKDQSYALWGIKQENLARTIFPLGDLSKQEIRSIAEEHNLITARKKESMDICFVPNNNYKQFLTGFVKGLRETVAHGELVDSAGRVVGEHAGYPFYTIGQRRGIGKGFGKPMYVVHTDAQHNRVVIGEEKDLYTKSFTARAVNFVSIADAEREIRARVKIRYRNPAEPATVQPLSRDRVKVVFDRPMKAITPGQSAVFYDGERVLGGGIIEAMES